MKYPLCIEIDLHIRPLVKSAYQKNNFLISQPKHMIKLTDKKNIYNFTLKNCLSKPVLI